MSEYRFALRAYPASYRDAHGAELVETANQLTRGRWSLRQSRSLTAGGLQARARTETGCTTRGVWESAFRVGLLLALVVGAAPELAFALGLGSSTIYEEPLVVLVAPAVLVAALTVSTRWWVAALVTAARLWALWTLLGNQGPTGWLLSGRLIFAAVSSALLMIGLAWWLALATDGRRAASPLMGFGLMTAATMWAAVEGSGLILEFGVGMSVLIIGALFIAPSDPRPAASAAVFSWFVLVSAIPFAVTNTDIGWRYWGPITLSMLSLLVPLLATRFAIRRMFSA